MRDQIEKYTRKLVYDRAALPGCIAFAAQDDLLLSEGNRELAGFAAEILSSVPALALVAARPALPFADFLVRRAAMEESRIVPRDSETRTFLHDIPFIRREELAGDAASRVAGLLARRKGCIVEGLGIVATGAMTVEQSYINYSSIFHALFVKYLSDLLLHGFVLPGEEVAFRRFRNNRLQPLTMEGLRFRPGPLPDVAGILSELATVGRYTVERGLVDSFFGNISCFADGVIYISQTGAGLDELDGCIDPVPMDGSSTAGITASSELPAHRRIYEVTEARTILHGHPKFSVVMSMCCEVDQCRVSDCWKECPMVRYLGDTPIVAGETGAGGLANSLPPVIGATGKAMVYGHGVFAIGRKDFAEPFNAMVELENRCRSEYFRRIDARRPR